MYQPTGVQSRAYVEAGASDARVQAYVRQVYQAFALAKPDFIWFDDDLRLEPHGNIVLYPCFCEGCLAQFSRETGRSWTRESLREAFRSESLENRLELRRQWLEHNRQYAARLLAIMREAVDAVLAGKPVPEPETHSIGCTIKWKM